MKQIGGGERLVGVISDTESSIQVGFTSRLVADYNSSKLTNNDIVKTTNWQVSVVNGAPKMMLLDASIVGKYDGIVPDVPQVQQQKVPSAPTSTPLSHRAPVSPSEYALLPCHTKGNVQANSASPHLRIIHVSCSLQDAYDPCG